MDLAKTTTADFRVKRITIISILIFLTGFTTGLFQGSFGIGAVGMAVFFISAYFIIVSVVQKKIVLKSRNRLFTNLLLISVLLIILGLMVSTIISSSSELAVRFFPIAIQYFFSFYIVYIFIASLNKRQLDLLLVSYILGGLVLGVAAIIIYFHAYDYGLQKLLIWRNGRLQMFSGANGLAPHMVLLSILLIYIIVRKQLGSIYYLLLIIPFWVIMLSGSNTGMILYFVSVFGLLAVIRGLKLKLMLAMLAVMAFFVLLNIEYYSEEYDLPVLNRFQWISSTEVEEAGTFQERSEAIHVAWSHIMDNPIIGIGAGSAGSSGAFATQVATGSSSQPHNVYVLLWAEGGVITILGLLAWLITILSASFKVNGKQRMFILFAALTLALAISMRAHSYQLWLTLPIYLLIVMIFHEKQEEQNSG